jgi:hypothetical protein
MKKIIVTLFGILIAQTSFATGKGIVRCSNGEETSVRIIQTGLERFRADVTVQSVGDTYPTFHFQNIRVIATEARDLVVYRGPGFELTIRFGSHGAHTVLNVPSLGIQKDDSLACR